MEIRINTAGVANSLFQPIRVTEVDPAVKHGAYGPLGYMRNQVSERRL
jgi:hypothetical protein